MIDSRGGLQPRLAAELPSQDRGTWRINADGTMATTWKIRPNALWHDGQPVRAQDFIFAHQVYLDPEIEVVNRNPEVLMQGLELLDGSSVPVSELSVGDRFLVRPGEKVATDGVVEEGASAIDASLLTGESVPVDVGPGDEVVGATVNAGGRLVVRATKVGAETALADIKSGKITSSNDPDCLTKADVIIICVPTPLRKTKEPDISYILAAAEQVRNYLHPPQLIVLESTTYPGTTRELLLPKLESTGLVVGEDFFLCFSPERVDPGREDFTTINTPKVMGGITRACGEVAATWYEGAIQTIHRVSSAETAEMAKLLENTFRMINIGLVNELAIMCERLGVDVWEVIDAAATKPFGFVPYYPGPGLGGHCIPIDPYYLTWKAKEFGVDTRFIELAGEINHAMPDYVVEKVARALNRERKPVRGSRALVLGIAYKKNVDDMRESPAVELIERLQHLGARVDYSDPHIPVFPRIRRASYDLKSVRLTPRTLARYDAVLLATNHDAFDYDLIAKHAKLVIDTRGVYRKPRKNVVKA